MKFEPVITVNKTSDKGPSVEVEWEDKRYVVYFDQTSYGVFIGEEGGGAFIEAHGIGGGSRCTIEYWPRW